MTPTRHFLKSGRASGKRDRISHPRTAAVAAISTSRIHTGQEPSSTSSPFEKTDSGY